MGTKSKSFALVLVLLFLTSLVALQTATVKANPKTITVPDDYSDIQTAIDNANAGDILFVKRGIYHENLTINKPLSLFGEGSEKTTISGFKSYNLFAPDVTIQIYSDQVTVSGFNLTNCSVGISATGNSIRLLSNTINCYPTGIQYRGSNGTIANNTIISNQYASMSINGSYNIIHGNTITHGITQGYMDLEGSFNSMVGNSIEHIELWKANSNIISNNNCTYFLLTENCSQNILFRNLFDGEHRQGYSPVRIWGSNNVFSENYFSNAAYGASIGHSGIISTGNKFYHNMFVNNSEEHVSFHGDSKWSDNFWDNGAEGNYYDDYSGNDNNRDGIGDSPYTVQEIHWDEELQRDVTVVFFQDRYPLKAPYDIENNRVDTPLTETSPTLLIAVLITAIMAVIIGLLLFRRHRKTNDLFPR